MLVSPWGTSSQPTCPVSTSSKTPTANTTQTTTEWHHITEPLQSRCREKGAGGIGEAGRLEKGKPKGNEKDEAKKGPKSIAWGRLQGQGCMAACHYSAHVLVRRRRRRCCYCTASSCWLSRATTRLPAARVRVAGSLPLDRATGRRHATVGRAGRLSRREISGLPRPA
ncbi:hypothetical protein M441DRAFT_342036 [Trichoderma asperellum CBS 433.97]|uniref:Uncharacterized protein n=1 Tax=Trichoderma asperellum (strain ATCC 204424 / CBS 433.97 / NBRC 101777) TaxID=1042311 RepID=A0A2T3ZH65_TRIA4|nr:hypothetical protein M441DRAFT_342036 [Trichoderma asperellum CBS 433.97]PTB44130.1 hypothetical protein M441DRAFT_342036 [Trichoderma asperellum CBS 433.97]